MSEEKKTAVTEEVKEEVRKLTEEELAQVNGGLKLDLKGSEEKQKKYIQFDKITTQKGTLCQNQKKN